MAGPPSSARVPVTTLKSPQRFPWTALGVFMAVGLFVYYAWLWLAEGKPVSGALVLGPVLVGITIPLFVRANRLMPAVDAGGLLLVGLVLRFAFAYYRFDHAGDALSYHNEGIRLAAGYGHLDFSAPAGAPVPGTGGMNVLSGALHVIVGNDFFATFLLMAWLSFLGCWFLYRAFMLSVDNGDSYRYARLIFLWPSMAFWPSSLGKDSWMIFTIGLASYGAARVLRRMAGGYTLMGIGLLAASFIRPHLALLALMAFMVALLVGRRVAARTTVTPGFLAKLVGIGLILVLGSVLISRTQTLLGVNDLTSTSIESAATRAGTLSTEGESAFTPANPRSLTGFPEATITVLFRPFPTEAHGLEQLGGAIEGVMLVAITLFSLRRLATIPRRLRAQPYITYALVYVLLWILAFGVIGNFGILARQRTQMLPFFFVLLSVNAVATRTTRKATSGVRPALR